MKVFKFLSATILAAAIACCCACGETNSDDTQEPDTSITNPSDNNPTDNNPTDENSAETDTMDAWTGGKLTFSDYVETYELDECSLTNPPTVVCDVTSEQELNSLKNTKTAPSNVVLRFNKNYNIVDEEGKKLDSFANIYNNILKGKTIPVLYLANEECADAAITFLTERMDISDLAVMSPVPAAVLKVRKAFPSIRGILSYDSLQSPVGVARTANAAMAATVVIPQSAATAETVRYIAARFKTVWVKADGCDEVNLYDCLGSGAYGIIGSDFGEIYNFLADCSKGATRMPFNVAHRGLPNTHHENSVSGAIAADAAGASHVELDGHLSKDGHIVMMHNDTLSATANGSGAIADMTLEEIRQYKLWRTNLQVPEEIPTLEDIIDALKETDCVLVFEIKGGGKELIHKLKDIIEEKDFAEQIVVITFASDFVEEMNKTLPEIPTALLANSMPADAATIERFTRLNAGISAEEEKNMSKEFEKFYKDRGMTGWFWTFSTAGQAIEAAEQGYIGITNNAADKFASADGEKALVYVKAQAEYEALSSVEEGDKVSIIGVAYSGEEITRTGTVRFVKDLGDKYAVVATCDVAKSSSVYSPRLYTQVFYIDKA